MREFYAGRTDVIGQVMNGYLDDCDTDPGMMAVLRRRIAAIHADGNRVDFSAWEQKVAHIAITNGDRQIWIAERHALYERTLTRDFDHYFDAVVAERVADFSRARDHRIRGFDDFHIYCPSFAESYASAQQYVEMLELSPGDVVWDAGAYSGLTAIVFSKVAGANGAVLTLEPDAENYAAARVNLERHRLRNGLDNVSLIPAALAPVAGLSDFCADGTEGAAIAPLVNYRTPAVLVPCVTLENLYTATLTAPDAIKMDIEGAEWAVLFEGMEFLDSHHPRLVIEPHKINGEMCTDRIVDLLRGFDYDCTLVAQPGVASTPLIVAK